MNEKVGARMKEFVEKLIERLEEEKKSYEVEHSWNYAKGLEYAVSIVNLLAEEFGGDINVGSKKQEPYSRIETVKSEHLECEVPSDCYEQIKEVWVIDEFTEERKVFNQDSTKKNQWWIPVTERMPEDCDHRFYMCIVENHEEDLPIFCQYEEDYGFGFWQDYYDGHTLGFLDSKFRTNEELGYEKVIAWQQIPEYKPEENQEEPQPNFYSERFNRVQ